MKIGKRLLASGGEGVLEPTWSVTVSVFSALAMVCPLYGKSGKS